MQLFFIENLDFNDTTLILSKEESKHIVRVLRMKEGDSLLLTNGKGLMVEAAISDANQNKCEVSISKKKEDFEKRDYYIHMAVAPTKMNDRYEYFLEKATEIGFDEITPIICSRSERKLVKLDRLKKVVLSAAKQSQKAFLPKVNDAVKFGDFVKTQHDADKFIAHCIEDEKKSLKTELAPNKKYLVLIGPEGDFSKEEVDLAIANNFSPVSLGNFRLRTETAAIVAVHSIAFTNE